MVPEGPEKGAALSAPDSADRSQPQVEAEAAESAEAQTRNS